MTLELQHASYRAYHHLQGEVRIHERYLDYPDLSTSHEVVHIVRPRYVGICTADLREVAGAKRQRCDFGHEVIGTVIHASNGAAPAGTLVALNPFAPVSRGTGFAEMLYVAGTAVAVSDALIAIGSLEPRFTLTEPLACAIHAAKRIARFWSNNPRALIVGAGVFGYLLYCYLDHRGIASWLGNRSADRLAELTAFSPGLRQLDDRFATEVDVVFLMQSRTDRNSLAAAANQVREGGAVVLFGSVSESEEQLNELRRSQSSSQVQIEGRNLTLVGTLDAEVADLREASALLATDYFASVTRGFFRQIPFEDGARRLMQRVGARAPTIREVIDIAPALAAGG